MVLAQQRHRRTHNHPSQHVGVTVARCTKCVKDILSCFRTPHYQGRVVGYFHPRACSGLGARASRPLRKRPGWPRSQGGLQVYQNSPLPRVAHD